MQNLLRNLRFSFRMLLKNLGLTLTILLTLALGVGANTAIFTVDYATLLQPLPYPEPKQLVVVWSKIQSFHNSMSAGDFTDWKRENTTFQDMNAWTGSAFNLSTKDQPEQIDGRMQSTLYGVSALDLSAFSIVGCVLLIAALVACFLPAHRAASTEPMRVLRTE